MAYKIRFLLTNKCTASCNYCHNEGQGNVGNILPLGEIQHVLDTLKNSGKCPSEIVLSGGEPTLHRELAQIARVCKQTGAYVSMNSHAGHPALLSPALPYLDELKVHLDSFNPVEQENRMGINLGEVLASIREAQRYPLKLITNHPLTSEHEVTAFISEARHVGIDCKIIEMFGHAGHPPIDAIDWKKLGYQKGHDGSWQHRNRQHRLFMKRCTPEDNPTSTLFIGPGGVRQELNGHSLGLPSSFKADMIRPATYSRHVRQIAEKKVSHGIS